MHLSCLTFKLFPSPHLKSLTGAGQVNGIVYPPQSPPPYLNTEIHALTSGDGIGLLHLNSIHPCGTVLDILFRSAKMSLSACNYVLDVSLIFHRGCVEFTWSCSICWGVFSYDADGPQPLLSQSPFFPFFIQSHSLIPSARSLSHITWNCLNSCQTWNHQTSLWWPAIRLHQCH